MTNAIWNVPARQKKTFTTDTAYEQANGNEWDGNLT